MYAVKRVKYPQSTHIVNQAENMNKKELCL